MEITPGSNNYNSNKDFHEEKMVIKKTLSEREIDKTNSTKIILHNLTNSTKNATSKPINFHSDINKISTHSGETNIGLNTNSHFPLMKKMSGESTGEKNSNNNSNKHINFKILNDDKIPTKTNIPLREKIDLNLKLDTKLIPKTKDLKTPFTQLAGLQKAKTDVKFPNSSRASDGNKVIFEPNLINPLKKDLLGSTKILKKVGKK